MNNHSVLSPPMIIGFMSVDGERRYQANISQLKYLNNIPEGKVEFDLNHNLDRAVKRTTDDNNEKIDLLLKFLKNTILYILPHYRNSQFITYRRTLINIMYNTYQVNEPLNISATLYKGKIYLHSVETSEQVTKRKSRTQQEKKFCAWGYKFEQYLLADHPSILPNIERPVVENEEFSIFYHASLKDINLLYGAQIDGMLVTDSDVENPPDGSDYNTSVAYLKKQSFVELKTNREIQNFKQERNFKRYKLMKCWCQCYLANLKGLLVGFRDDNGIIKRLKWFSIGDIADYCQNEWHPQDLLDYLYYFLHKIKESFRCYEDMKETHTLHIKLNLDKSVTIMKVESNDVLPDWYIKND